MSPVRVGPVSTQEIAGRQREEPVIDTVIHKSRSHQQKRPPQAVLSQQLAAAVFKQAERAGFEPAYPGEGVTALAMLRIRPLCHLSVGIRWGRLRQCSSGCFEPGRLAHFSI